VFTKDVFVKPSRHLTPEPTLTFGRMEEAGSVQGMAGEGRGTLARDHQHQAVALPPLAFQKVIELHACHLDAVAVQINPGVGLKLAAREALCRTPVKGRKRGWFGVLPACWPDNFSGSHHMIRRMMGTCGCRCRGW